MCDANPKCNISGGTSVKILNVRIVPLFDLNIFQIIALSSPLSYWGPVAVVGISFSERNQFIRQFERNVMSLIRFFFSSVYGILCFNRTNEMIYRYGRCISERMLTGYHTSELLIDWWKGKTALNLIKYYAFNLLYG